MRPTIETDMELLERGRRGESDVLLGFRWTAEDLSEPPAGGERKTLFDWQNQPDLGRYGGLEGLAAGLGSSLTDGLTEAEVAHGFERREQVFGTNKKPERHSATYWELIWEGLHDFTLVVLIVAAVVSIVLGMSFEDPSTGWIEGAAILSAVVIVLNVAAVNDMQKDKQFQELSKENDAAQNVTVRRGGKNQELQVEFLQVGDLVILDNGKKVPADCIFVSGQDVEIDESAMTGESQMAKKSAAKPFLISGSEIRKASEVYALVVAVGINSVQGRAMALLQTDNPETPLQSKLEKIATQVSVLGFWVAIVCVVVMWVQHFVAYGTSHGTINDETGDPEWDSSNYSDLLEAFIVAITVLVVAIPEGLPLAVTIALAYSVKKMMKDSNLVRHLDACETMGGATTICSDKTGTLTQNKMTVMQCWVSSSEALTASSGEFAALFLSQFRHGTAEEYSDFIENSKGLNARVRDAVMENSLLNASAKYSEADNKWMGMPTEIALVVYAEKMGLSMTDARAGFPVVHVNPFTSDRKRSSVVVQRPDGGFRVYVKGASEMVLRLCDRIVDKDGNERPLAGNFEFGSAGAEGAGEKFEIGRRVIASMADAALRTLALGFRDFPSSAAAEEWTAKVVYNEADGKGAGECPAAEDGLVLACVVGIQDPVRPEVPESVRKCQEAGIVVRMVTGDNVATARAIAVQCGILKTEPWVDAFGTNHEAGAAIEGEEFRNRVGGLTLPPHFYHRCECADLTQDPYFRPMYQTEAYPKHFGYPSIVGHNTTECEHWAVAEAEAGDVKCTKECSERGCFKKMKDSTSASELEQYKVVKNQAQFDEIWPTMAVMARSTPTDKHLFVSGLSERGQVVAVTGDGTNDGPALKKAHVGFAMGIAGTDVAKEASDIILMDDNFTSIVAAVKWGRNVYDSIRKFLQFQLTVNVVALAIAFLGSCVLTESPLTAVQMLWVNLIMDTFASLALATEPPTDVLLTRKPYGRDDSLISQVMTRNILGQSLFQIIILTAFIFWGHEMMDIPIGSMLGHEALPTQHYTMIFQVFVMMQVFNEINARKIDNEMNVFEGIFDNGIFVGIVVLTIVVQYVLSMVGGIALSVEPLSIEQHVVCLVIGAWGLVMQQLIRFVPSKLFTMFGRELLDEKKDRKYSMFMRRNSRKSVTSLPRLSSESSLSI